MFQLNRQCCVSFSDFEDNGVKEKITKQNTKMPCCRSKTDSNIKLMIKMAVIAIVAGLFRVKKINNTAMSNNNTPPTKP